MLSPNGSRSFLPSGRNYPAELFIVIDIDDIDSAELFVLIDHIDYIKLLQ